MFKDTYRIWIAIIGLMFLITPIISVVGTAQTSETTDHAAEARADIQKALDWLRTRQMDDGSWLASVGVTSMGVMAFTNGGVGSDDPAVVNALNYIIDEKTADGSFTSGTNVVYETSLAIVALTSTRNPEYKDDVEAAVRFLETAQKTEDNSDEDWWVGGIGYGGDGRPDLSNNQFAVMAFHSAATVYDIDLDESTWNHIETFTTRCQNHQETNPEWAAYDDGGFMYFPGYSHAGEDTSYGSMTAAGIWCYVLSGVDKDDARVEAAANWLEENHKFTENPGIGQTGLYYYYWTYARAMTLYGEPLGNWYNGFLSAISERQLEDGSWINSESDWWWENVPEVATLYAVNALESAILPWADGITLEIELHSDKNLHVFDDDGLHSGDGVLVTRMAYEEGIPSSKVIKGSDFTKVVIENADSGAYKVRMTDGEEGSYDLKVTVKRDGKVLDENTLSGKTTEDTESLLIINSISAPGSVYVEEPAERESTGTFDYEEESKVSYTPLIIGAIAILAVLIVLSVIVIKKRH